MPEESRQTPRAAPGPAPTPTQSCRARLAAGLVLVVLIAVAYSNSLRVPLIYDDQSAITDNESIKHLATAFTPTGNPGLTVAGRPVLNASFALNHVLTGDSLAGLHLMNLLIHLLAALTLWGLIRRTLERPRFGGRFAAAAGLIAWLAALLWAIHPLQTESVTYLVQRAESLMGLFYLLTLYCFVRSLDAAAPHRWQALSFAACLLGMATKEVMVSAPLLVLLYDRTFAARSFRTAWQQRWKLYLSLAGTWLLLGILVASGGGTRGGSSANVNFWVYAATQFEALVRYLWLSVWPHPLIFHYGAEWVRHPLAIAPYSLLVVLLAAGTLVAIRKNSPAGFAGAWFFLILAPTSLVPGNVQTIAEHRMYLPLAGVLTLIVLGLHRLLGPRLLVAGLALTAGLGWATFQRNHDYRSEISLWSDTVAKRPSNPQARNNLGAAYLKANRYPEAIESFSALLDLAPNSPVALNNLGVLYSRMQRLPEAIRMFSAAIAANPQHAESYLNLAQTLLQAGRLEEAITQYEAALRLDPANGETRRNLGLVLLLVGKTEEGIHQLRESVRLAPGDPGAQSALVRGLVEAGHLDEAATACEDLVRLAPTADNYSHLGVLQARSGRLEEARDAFRAALRIDPAHAEAGQNLARVNAALAGGGTP